MSTLATAAPIARRRVSTRALLTAGSIAGPLFVCVVVAQALTRDGFSMTKHPLSLLSLGDLGWIQITNFIVSGLLAIVGGFGVRRALRDERGGKWGAHALCLYGAALIWGGVFLADPALGYPAGSPEQPTHLSWHSILHTFAPIVAGLATLAANIIFTRRFLARGERGWAAYSIVSLVAYFVGMTALPTGDFRWMYVGGSAIWIWAAAAVAHIRRTYP